MCGARQAIGDEGKAHDSVIAQEPNARSERFGKGKKFTQFWIIGNYCDPLEGTQEGQIPVGDEFLLSKTIPVATEPADERDECEEGAAGEK